MNVTSVLEALRDLMVNPNASDPMDAYKGTLYKDNRTEYESEVFRHSVLHANLSLEDLKIKYNLS